MIEYNKVNVKLTNKQLKKLKSAAKNKTGATLRMSLNVWRTWSTSWTFTDNKIKTKLRNAFNNNMPTDIKLSKDQTSKIIQSGRYLGSLILN